MKASVELPEKLIPVFTGKARYRGAYGGRGSGKSFSFAKMTAVFGYRFAVSGRSGAILCGRKMQNSLEESSLEEVKRAIRSEEWLKDFYDIGEKYIRSKDGRIRYVFSGLDRNIESIKSKAAVLIAWVDEADGIEENAWKKLIPTIREPDSEIWITWNPEVDGSSTDNRFKKDPPENSNIVEINWNDNPWFPKELRYEMEEDFRKRPEDAEHIWNGAYLVRSDAQVFKNWHVEEFETHEDADFRFGADWGFSVDPTVLIRCYIKGRKLYIDYEAYQVGCEIIDTPALFLTIPESEKWPITADSARPETISHMKINGFPKIMSAIKGPKSIEEGVEWLKTFQIIVHPRCTNTIRELTMYSYKIDKMTDSVLPVLSDKENHLIDALRYACEGARRTQRRYKETVVSNGDWCVFG